MRTDVGYKYEKQVLRRGIDMLQGCIDNLDHKRKHKKVIVQSLKDGTEVARFSSMAEADRQTGISIKAISKCVLNDKPTAGGYCWDRIEVEK